MVRNDIKCPWLFFIDIFSQSVLDIDAQYSWNQEENKIFYSTYYQRERSSLKKSYGSLSRNNKWTLGSFILSRPIVVILTHFVNVYWTSPKQWNLETSVSCFPEMQRKLFTLPAIFQQQFSWLSAIYFIKLSALTIFCWIKQVPSLIFFKLLTERLFSILFLRQQPTQRN